MDVFGIIPARYGSTRFPGKPLVKIHGKPLIQWVIEGARQSSLLTKVIVATDHLEIFDFVKSIGCDVAMTPSDLPSGSDRAWQVVKDADVDVVVNIQGDEPLITGEVVDALVEPFAEDSGLQMATLGRAISAEDLASNNTAKIVLNHRHEALYFSRQQIPYSRLQLDEMPGACLKHIGIYAYRKDFLGEFCAQQPVAIEKAESLEQLRALYLGARIKVVPLDVDSWGVDSPEDVEKIERLLEQAGRC